ncbi:MAG: energy transducer TonB [Gammaproteobacteria bacterium]|nr:energy transducer TonB [Gammaproteobacteria bacterium]MYF59204.1 energy transducer TonB [Gammaproteobacteria bacterium]MYH32506.1 energy transducer TonB [Gammaproteobacteria bacterium]MYH34564.1 energy transducer TonB [Gammaproteobacteria bacterium]
MDKQQPRFHWSKRYGLALAVGGVAALALLWFMQFLITTGEAALTEDRSTGFVDFVRVIPEELPPPPKPPDRPPELQEPPPPITTVTGGEVTGPAVFVTPPPTVVDTGTGSTLGTLVFDGDLVPLVPPNPIYPQSALRRGLEGYCDLEFSITELGTTTDVRVIYCTSSLFERASIRAMQKAKYKPRVNDGVPIAVYGRSQRLSFEIEK